MTDHVGRGQSDPQAVLAARSLVRLVGTLMDGGGGKRLADRLVEDCLEVVGVDAAVVLLFDPDGALAAVASSGNVAHLAGLAQTELWSATGSADEEPVILDEHTRDEHTRDRTPGDSCRKALLDAGYSAVYPFPLRSREHTLGTLYLLLRDRPPLSASDRTLARALADAAAITLLHHWRLSRAVLLAEQLQGALNSRISVERATGVLAEYAGIGMGAAFDGLRSYARSNRLKLSLVAEKVVARELDPGQVMGGRRRR